MVRVFVWTGALACSLALSEPLKKETGKPLKLVRKIPHFGYSEGLTYHKGHLWHANPKKLYKIDPKTGGILQEFKPATEYSESLVWQGGKLWNVSFKNNGLYSGVLGKKEFAFTRRGSVPEKHAWGLETDGKHLIVTGNYSNKLYFISLKTFKVVRLITVDAKDLEDLAWDGKGIWTSSFTTHSGQIFRVNPKTGKRGSLFSLPDREDCPIIDGIAYHKGELYITGKNCPSIWVVKKPSEKEIRR